MFDKKACGSRAPSASVVCILANYYKTFDDYIWLGAEGSNCADND